MKKLLLLLILFSAPAWAAEVYTNQTTVTVSITATDEHSGMGPGALMRLSNDGETWSPPEPFEANKEWSLTEYGGSDEDGPHAVYAKVSDRAGNWSEPMTGAVLVDRTKPVIEIMIIINNPAGE